MGVFKKHILYTAHSIQLSALIFHKECQITVDCFVLDNNALCKMGNCSVHNAFSTNNVLIMH